MIDKTWSQASCQYHRSDHMTSKTDLVELKSMFSSGKVQNAVVTIVCCLVIVHFCENVCKALVKVWFSDVVFQMLLFIITTNKLSYADVFWHAHCITKIKIKSHLVSDAETGICF